MVASVALPAVLASEVGYSGKTISQKRLAPDSLIYLVPTALPMVFSWAVYFCQDVTHHCVLAESADSPLFVCHDYATPPLLGCKHGMGSLGFRWYFGVLTGGANCTNVHLARLIVCVKGDGLDVHDISLASGSADVLSDEVSPANAYCSGTSNVKLVFVQSRGRSLRAAALAAGQWSSSLVMSPSWRSAIVVPSPSMTPPSNSNGRPVWL